MELYVCQRCKKLTQSLVAGVCTNCYKSQIADFQRVKEYLWEHPNTKLQVVAKECNVSVSQIREWIKEEKLELFNLDPSITCKRCGQPIFQGCYCDFCKKQLFAEFQSQAEPDTKNKAEKQGMHYLKRK